MGNTCTGATSTTTTMTKTKPVSSSPKSSPQQPQCPHHLTNNNNNNNRAVVLESPQQQEQQQRVVVATNSDDDDDTDGVSSGCGILEADSGAATLHASWALIEQKETFDLAGQEFYKRFFVQGGDDVRRMFMYTDMERQQRMLMQLCQWIVSSNFEPRRLVDLGVMHGHLGITAEHLGVFSRCLTSTFSDVLKENWTSEMDWVWTGALTVVSSHFMQGVMRSREAVMRAKALGTVPRVVQKKCRVMLSVMVQHKFLGEATFRPAECSLRGRYLYLTRVEEGSSGTNKLSSAAETTLMSSYDSCPLTPTNMFDDDATCTELDDDMSYSQSNVAPEKGCYCFCKPSAKSSSRAATGGRRHVVQATTHRRTYIIDMRESLLVDTDRVARYGLPLVGEFSFAVVSTSGGTPPSIFVALGDNEKERWYAALARAKAMFSRHSPIPDVSDIDLSVFGAPPSERSYHPDDFEWLTMVGRGTYGQVYKVRSKATGAIMAAKVLKKHDVMDLSSVVSEQQLLRDVRHPFIIRLHTAFQTTKQLCFLFDYLSAGELFFHLRQRDDLCFDEPTARFYIAQLGCAVGYLHERNILHRDIKAENLVLDGDGNVILTDFGFALLMHPQQNETLQCGTLSYVAPEVLNRQGGGYGLAVDWWSVGVVLFVMLTGCYPFLRPLPRDTMKAILTQPLMFPPQRSLSADAVDLLTRLLDKDPRRRLANLYHFQAHPFFKDMDWAALLRKEIPPPFVPDDVGKNTKYFADALTKEPVEGMRGIFESNTNLLGDWVVADAVSHPPRGEHGEKQSQDPNAASTSAQQQQQQQHVHHNDANESSVRSTSGRASSSRSRHSSQSNNNNGGGGASCSGVLDADWAEEDAKRRSLQQYPTFPIAD
eukprot:PhM_4_TR13856/c0_g1_i1/m.26375